MLQIIAWIGLGLLILAFGLLATKYKKYFILVDLIATIFLLIHAIIIKDLPFILAQTFISIALIITQTKGGIK